MSDFKDTDELLIFGNVFKHIGGQQLSPESDS